MDSPQSVVSPFKKLSVSSETEKKKTETNIQNPAEAGGYIDNGTEILLQDANHMHHNSQESIGVLDVHIHQARDIHNICIYHKQDVYAKICMTSDPDSSVSTQTINGGGQNPVFNQSLRVKIRTVESSLKCEIWMLSRVRNYLEDQLLGFALVPVSEILINNGKLEKEFSLSSTDLFHSPAGFVQLSLSYTGSSPDLMMISPKQHQQKQLSCHAGVNLEESEGGRDTCHEFDKIEFPDPNIANENQMMVSEYFEITANSMDSHSSESLVSSGIENHHQLDSENGHEVQAVESFSGNNNNNNTSGSSTPHSKINSPPTTSVSNNGSPVSVPASSQTSSETPRAHHPDTEEEEHGSSHKEDKEKNGGYTGEHIPSKDDENWKEKNNVGESESESSNNGQQPESSKEVPVVGFINVELPEEKVVQQDFVDMYMKSMQQFTESLAQMKLPMDHLGTTTTPHDESSAKSSENSSSTSLSSEKKVQGPKTPGSRVFYGSRAFF